MFEYGDTKCASGRVDIDTDCKDWVTLKEKGLECTVGMPNGVGSAMLEGSLRK